jgi:hypothetical protein
MADYQLAHLSLSTRLELAALMLNPFRPWGQVSELSRQYGVSRKFLYELRRKALQAVTGALLPQKPGRKVKPQAIYVDETFIQRFIAVCLSVVPGTVRTVRLLLELLLGVHRSTGFICQTAQALGAKAQQDNQNLHLPLQALAEADEIFQGRQPCLTLVDGRSFLVLSLSAQAHRDETTWGCVLLDVEQQGVQLVDLASDGARGIRAGAQAAGLAIPLRPDLFHLTREAHRVTRRLKKQAYRALESAERARRASQEQDVAIRRRGAPLKVKVALPQAEAEERQAIERLDAWDWLLHEIRQAIEPVSAQGQITSSRQARQTVEVALELLQTLNHETVQNFAHQFREKLDELLAPLEWLEQSLAPWRAGLDPQTEAFIVWAWQHQKELDIPADQVLSENEATRVAAIWETLSLFHRSSSLAESLHSWLRPYLQVHRGVPAWLLPLLQAVWNHHPFQRGKRQGKSPLALAGVEDVPTLAELFDRLVGVGQPIPAPDWFFKVPQKCYPISATL